VRALNATAFTVNRAVLVTVPSEAEMVDVVDLVRKFVAMVNVAVLAPAGTVTLPGTVAAAVLLLARAMVVSTAVCALRVIVPVEASPPTTVVGLSDKVDSAGGFTVRVAVLVTVPSKALMTTAV
jgi:hypothetical protein